MLVFVGGGLCGLVPTAMKHHWALCTDIDIIYKLREEHVRSHLLLEARV